ISLGGRTVRSGGEDSVSSGCDRSTGSCREGCTGIGCTGIGCTGRAQAAAPVAGRIGVRR
ncbi:MAG: hypothetical protein RKK15_08115, partial [Defluviicoccus sp.]|nr:hypothetical protein [Defluviicoccus sp.]